MILSRLIPGLCFADGQRPGYKSKVFTNWESPIDLIYNRFRELASSHPFSLIPLTLPKPSQFTALRKKHEFYKIGTSWVAIDPVPVISTPTYGNMTAPTIVKQLEIQ